MKIRIRDVVSGGIQLNYVLKPSDIGLEGEDFIDPEDELKVVADLKRVNDFVLAKIAVTFMMQDFCARCLEHLSREVITRYEIEFEFKLGDEWLDIGERIREEMIIGYLPRALCREDCKGICPGCGADLNTEQCECQKE
ncbi:MAG: DUF177 domain-containing protein [Candidatus Omnitrophota bacterium]